MAVTAAMVKELREMSGAGMSACKNALVEADGNMERASEILREKGLAAAAKKAGRVAAEGLVWAAVSNDRRVGAVVEINSETDFVSKNQAFIDFVTQTAEQALASSASDLDAFLSEAWIGDPACTVKDAATQKVALFGENINIRRFERFEVDRCGAVVEYIHGGGKVVVLLEMETETVNELLIEAGRNLCMQIAAMSPKFVSRADVSEEFIAKEREILTQQAVNEGKSADIAAKMVQGRLNKEMKEFCLMDQEYVKDSDQTVKQYIDSVARENGAAISVKRFVRYEKGEGIQKKEENFAEEVSKAMNV